MRVAFFKKIVSVSVIITFISFSTETFGFNQYPTFWRGRHLDFGRRQVANVFSTEKYPTNAESYKTGPRQTETERLQDEILKLNEKLQKCTLFSKTISQEYDQNIPKARSSEIRTTAWYQNEHFNYNEPWKGSDVKKLFPTYLNSFHEKPPTMSLYRKPKPSWTLATHGNVPKDYNLAEPLPGLLPNTPPLSKLPRKLFTDSIGGTRQIIGAYASKIASSDIPTMRFDQGRSEPLIVDKPLPTISNITTIFEMLKANNTSDNKYNWNNVVLGEQKSRNHIKRDYLIQPRRLFDSRNPTEISGPRINLDSVSLPLIYDQIPPTTSPPPYHKTVEVSSEEPEIITAPYPFNQDDVENYEAKEASNTNSLTPLVITRENMRNFNLDESLIRFNVAGGDKNSEMENGKYRITDETYNMPYNTSNSSGMRQSRFGHISTLVSSSMLVKER